MTGRLSHQVYMYIGGADTFITKPGISHYTITAIGGGGGGGSGSSGATSVLAASTGGGGGSASQFKSITVRLAPGSYQVVVGGGGSGGLGVSGAATPGNNGADGSDTWFSDGGTNFFLYVAGGSKGFGGVNSSSSAIVWPKMYGGQPIVLPGAGGAGGNSYAAASFGPGGGVGFGSGFGAFNYRPQLLGFMAGATGVCGSNSGSYEGGGFGGTGGLSDINTIDPALFNLAFGSQRLAGQGANGGNANSSGAGANGTAGGDAPATSYGCGGGGSGGGGAGSISGGSSLNAGAGANGILIISWVS